MKSDFRNTKEWYKCFIITIILMAAVLMLVCFTMPYKVQCADAAELNDVGIDATCAEMTKTKSPSGINIYEYIADFRDASRTRYDMIATLGRRQLFQNGCELEFSNSSTAAITAYADDNITKIVPRQLFTYECEKLYIGEQYGFYINTHKVEETNELISTVIIIDVLNSNSIGNDYVFDSTIKPLVQIDYHYVNKTPSIIKAKNNKGAYEQKSMTIGLANGVSGAVIPSVRVYDTMSTTGTITYKQFIESNDFSISDISFSANVYNQNSLNAGDVGYSIDNDYGYFIIGNDYYYSAHAIGSGTSASVTEIASSMISTALGFVPVLGDVFSVSNAVLNISNEFSRVAQTPVYDVTNKNYYYEALELANTRASQKHAFGMLIKSSAIAVNSSGTLVFENGDSARCLFRLSHTDNPNGIQEYGQIKIGVHVKVVNNADNYKCKVLPEQVLYYDINSPQQTETEIFEQSNYYLLPGGSQAFVFVPKYSGKYELVVNNTNVEIYVNNKLESQNNGIIQIDIRQGARCAIKFINKTDRLQTGVFNVDIASLSSGQSFSASLISDGGLYIVKYKPTETRAYTCKFNGGIINDVLQLEENKQLERLYYLDNYIVKESIDLVMMSGENYYFLIDKANGVQSDIVVNITQNVKRLSAGETNLAAVEQDDNFRYYEFTPTAAVSDYNFLFSGLTSIEDVFAFRMFDSDGNIVSIDWFSYGYVKAYSLIGGETYYIGVKSSATVSSSVKIVPQTITLSWKVYKGNTLVQNSSQTSITLERDNNYRVELWLNDHLKAPRIKIIDAFNNQGLTDINNISGNIKITDERIDNTSFTILAYKGDSLYDNEELFDTQLIVTPIFDVAKISVDSVNYENAFRVNWSIATDYENITYSISGKSENGNSFYKQYQSNAATNADFLDYLLSNKAVEAVFKLESVKIKSGGSNSYKNESLNITKDLNCMYSRVETRRVLLIFTVKDYYIANELHLYNIRNDQSYSRYLDNDINLTKPWTPISTLTCSIYGKGHKIKNLSFYIGSGAPSPINIGLVEVNKATISNLTIDGISMNGAEGQHFEPWYYIGAIAGVNEGNISSCKVTGSMTVHRAFSALGGIAGRNSGTIRSCYFGLLGSSRSYLYGNGDVGGIAGQNTGTIDECYTENTDIRHYVVHASHSAGGIAGYCSGGKILSSAVHNINISNANPDPVTNTSIAPKMGLIVGHIENGVIKAVGMSNSTYGYGGLTFVTRVNSFNGGWPFYGLMTNTQVDDNMNQNGP